MCVCVCMCVRMCWGGGVVVVTQGTFCAEKKPCCLFLRVIFFYWNVNLEVKQTWSELFSSFFLQANALKQPFLSSSPGQAGHGNLVSLFSVFGLDEGKVPSMQVFDFMTGVLCFQFLRTLKWENRTFMFHVFQQWSEECVILRTTFSGGGKSFFYWKQTWLKQRFTTAWSDFKPSDYLPFFMFRLLQISSPSEQSRIKKKQMLVDLVFIFFLLGTFLTVHWSWMITCREFTISVTLTINYLFFQSEPFNLSVQNFL